MTDEEILFDFYTVVERQDQHKREQLERYELDEEDLAAEQPPMPQVLPSSGTDSNRVKTTSVRADKSEFIRWYEAEIGPWTQR